jgi:hypothetical protein
MRRTSRSSEVARDRDPRVHGIVRGVNPRVAAIPFKTRRKPLAMLDTERARRRGPTIDALQGISGFSVGGLGAPRTSLASLAGHFRVP